MARRPRGWLGLAAGLAATLLATAAAAASYVVNDTAELEAQLRRAQGGDVIRLAPGVYGDVTIRNIRKPSPVIIAAQSPERRPQLSNITIQTSSNLTFRDLDVSLAGQPGVVLSGSRNIRLEGVLIQGRATEDMVGRGNGMTMRSSRDVTVIGSEFRNLGNGLAHRDCERVLIQNNRFHEIRIDGIHGAATSDISIIGNAFWDFTRKPGEHPDAIQFWTTNAKESAARIRVEDNLIIRGSGGRMQGIFITDQSKGKRPYLELVVRGNAVVGSMYHGISVYNAVSPVVENNLVLGYDDMKSWIAVRYSSDAVVRNNQATQLRMKTENTNLQSSGNKTLRQAKIGDAKAVRTWYAQTRGKLPALPAEVAKAMQ